MNNEQRKRIREDIVSLEAIITNLEAIRDEEEEKASNAVNDTQIEKFEESARRVDEVVDLVGEASSELDEIINGEG